MSKNNSIIKNSLDHVASIPDLKEFISELVIKFLGFHSENVDKKVMCVLVNKYGERIQAKISSMSEEALFASDMNGHFAVIRLDSLINGEILSIC